MNEDILSADVQCFIRSSVAEKSLAEGLFKSPFNGVSPQELATQIKGYVRSREKMPRLAALQGIVYPAGVSVEQCSSEATADYKASLLPQGGVCADITGGFGIDTMALARRYERVDYFEVNEGLAETAAHNFRVAGFSNISVCCADGLTGVASGGKEYDCIYADPARRDARASRVYSVADCTPDISALKGALLQKARFLLVKLSPMLDIRATLKLFPETAQVHVVALRNEVKELLFLLERDFSGQVEVSAADLGKDGVADVFSAPPARMNAPAAVSPMKRYVYDPSAALRKAGLAEAYCAERGLEKLHPNTSLYTSDELAADFRGRVFRVAGPVDARSLKAELPDRRAAVIARNFPASAADLAKKFKLKDSATVFLIAFRNSEDKNAMILAEKVNFS